MEIYHFHGLQDLSVLPKLIYRFNARYFVDKDELTLNFYGKVNYRAVIIKMTWDWQRKRHRDQWDRTESPEIDHNTKY